MSRPSKAPFTVMGRGGPVKNDRFENVPFPGSRNVSGLGRRPCGASGLEFPSTHASTCSYSSSDCVFVASTGSSPFAVPERTPVAPVTADLRAAGEQFSQHMGALLLQDDEVFDRQQSTPPGPTYEILADKRRGLAKRMARWILWLHDCVVAAHAHGEALDQASLDPVTQALNDPALWRNHDRRDEMTRDLLRVVQGVRNWRAAISRRAWVLNRRAIHHGSDLPR